MGYYGHSKGNAIVIEIAYRDYDGSPRTVQFRRHHFDDTGLFGDCTAV